jgi:membrane protein
LKNNSSRLSKKHKLLKCLWVSLREFITEGGLDKVSLLAYYSILSILFLLTFFLYFFSKILADPQSTLYNIYPFSTEFFTSISPDLISKAGQLSQGLEQIGLIGIIISLVLGFIVIKKAVLYINLMFNIDLKKQKGDKGFIIRRMSEFSLLFLFAIISLLSFSLTNFITAMTDFLGRNQFLKQNIDPMFITNINHFLIKYIAPLIVTFIMFFIIFKWIPEKKVFVKGAIIATIISTLLWEIIKRLYAYYLINISVIGKIKGSFIAVILFAFWMEISFIIMLLGVKLTSVYDRIHDNEKNKTQEDCEAA